MLRTTRRTMLRTTRHTMLRTTRHTMQCATQPRSTHPTHRATHRPTQRTAPPSRQGADGKPTDVRFVVLILLEHFFLFSKLLLDALVPDVPSAAVETMALQRKLVALADEHATRGTVRLLGGTAKTLGAADYDAEPPVRAELKGVDEDLDGEEPIEDHRRMSDLGLLRSFRPSTEEELGDLAQQLGQAARTKDRKKVRARPSRALQPPAVEAATLWG